MADLKPTVDELPRQQEREERFGPVSGARAALHDVGDSHPSESTAPSFDKLPANLFAAKPRGVFVSYAWGDSTPEGRLREQVVDTLCSAVRAAGAEILRDRDDMQPGDRISEFMDRLAAGDHIVVVMSDKYLRSEMCMYELFKIFLNCRADATRFTEVVIPLILPDATIGRVADRVKRAAYWRDQRDTLSAVVRENVDVVGEQAFKKYKLIGEFAQHASDMLEFVVDILQPRDFNRQAAEGFPEVLGRIRKPQ